MTKEELKKEAIKYAVDYPTSYGKGYKHKDLRIAYLAGAEPREKRIAELERKLEQTEKDLTDYQFNYPKIKDLEKENAELKAQIERMKSDVKQLREDRMNDDTDQNIMDRLWEEWIVNFGVSN